MNSLSRTILLLSAALLAGKQANAEPLQAKQYADFDRYVLALSWQTGFCQNMHERNHHEPAECQSQQESNDKRAFLTIHGLWPGLPQSIAAHGVDEKRWMRYGCATRPLPNMPEARAARKCSAPDPGLSGETATKLADAMPGAGGRSCLDRYEYARHGVCFGFNANDYFATMIRLNSEVKQSALGDFLAQNYGKVVTRKTFNQAVKQSWGSDALNAIKLTCQDNPAYLTEMQLSLRAEQINQPLGAGSFMPQKHPGNCGKTFRLDAVGY